MKIQMVAGQVGERRGGDAYAVEAMLDQAVAGRLHREALDPGRGEPGERFVQLDRIRCRQAAADLEAGSGDPESSRLAALRPRRDQIWRRNHATEVLPLVPVTAAVHR